MTCIIYSQFVLARDHNIEKVIDSGKSSQYKGQLFTLPMATCVRLPDCPGPVIKLSFADGGHYNSMWSMPIRFEKL